MDEKIILYIIILKNDKRLLHVKTKNVDNLEDMIVELNLLYKDYLSINPILRIDDKITLHQIYEVDYFVKKFMKYYGIENVRGGSYSKLELTTEENNVLNKELEQTINNLKNNEEYIENIIELYKDKDKEYLQKEKENLNQKLYKYNYDKKMLKKLSNYKGIILNRDLLKDINRLRMLIKEEDLKDMIFNMDESYLIHIKNHNNALETLQYQYSKIFQKMRTVYTVLTNYTDVEITYEPKKNLYKPEDYFCVFFNIKSNNLDDIVINDKEVEDFNKLINYFEYLVYTLLNKIDEYEFDVSTYLIDFEKITSYKIEYINTLFSNIN